MRQQAAGRTAAAASACRSLFSTHAHGQQTMVLVQWHSWPLAAAMPLPNANKVVYIDDITMNCCIICYYIHIHYNTLHAPLNQDWHPIQEPMRGSLGISRSWGEAVMVPAAYLYVYMHKMLQHYSTPPMNAASVWQCLTKPIIRCMRSSKLD
jgi:hypothetical protein